MLRAVRKSRERLPSGASSSDREAEHHHQGEAANVAGADRPTRSATPWAPAMPGIRNQPSGQANKRHVRGVMIQNMTQRGETDLEMAVRRVAEARRTVERQRRLIARLKKAEKPTLHQRQTLLVLESILQITKVYERMIREEARAATVETDRKARRKI
jgi:hypothetical protein